MIDHTKKPIKQLSIKTSEQKEAEMFHRLLVDKWKEYQEWCNLAENNIIIEDNGGYTTYRPRLKTLEDFMDWLERNIDKESE